MPNAERMILNERCVCKAIGRDGLEFCLAEASRRLNYETNMVFYREFSIIFYVELFICERCKRNLKILNSYKDLEIRYCVPLPLKRRFRDVL